MPLPAARPAAGGCAIRAGPAHRGSGTGRRLASWHRGPGRAAELRMGAWPLALALVSAPSRTEGNRGRGDLPETASGPGPRPCVRGNPVPTAHASARRTEPITILHVTLQPAACSKIHLNVRWLRDTILAERRSSNCILPLFLLPIDANRETRRAN